MQLKIIACLRIKQSISRGSSAGSTGAYTKKGLNSADSNYLCGLMKKTVFLLSIIAIVFAAGCIGQGATSPVSANHIEIKDFAFNPSEISVSKLYANVTVTWTNTEDTTHTVTSDDGKFDSGPLSKGQSFSYAFTEFGVYKYHCAYHTSMTGEVRVLG